MGERLTNGQLRGACFVHCLIVGDADFAFGQQFLERSDVLELFTDADTPTKQLQVLSLKLATATETRRGPMLAYRWTRRTMLRRLCLQKFVRPWSNIRRNGRSRWQRILGQSRASSHRAILFQGPSSM